MSLQKETWLLDSPTLLNHKFQLGGEISGLVHHLPRSPGVYLIVCKSFSSTEIPDFVEKGTGGFHKGKNPNVAVEKLRNKWVLGTNVLYIGKAGGTTATLASRLNAYFRFGQGASCSHWGGRYIWQLPIPGKLLVYWLTLKCDSPAQARDWPRQVEKELLRRFESEFGRLPFANLKR